MRGEPFQVIDTSTGDDLTRTILLQVIMEQENRDQPIFTTEILAKIIRFYGGQSQGLFTNYLDQSLTLFNQQHQQFQQHVDGLFNSNKSATESISDLAQRNITLWRTMQQQFLDAMKLKPEPKESQSKGESDD